MIRSIRHLCGTSEEWEASSALVLPRGEIGVELTADGGARMKIGDGTRSWYSLPYANAPDLVITSEREIPLKSGSIFRIGGISPYVTLATPASYDDLFECEVSFTSGEDATEIGFANESVYFTGDDSADGVLLTRANRRYTLCIWYDGGFQGVVRSSAYA